MEPDDYYDFAEPERFLDEKDWDRYFAPRHPFQPQGRHVEYCGADDDELDDMCGAHISEHYLPKEK